MNQDKYTTSPVCVGVDELLALRQQAVSIGKVRKRVVSSSRDGAMQSRVLGRGLDFSELREYQGGDDIRQIDWNVTARTGKPFTKLFSIERERPYFAVVDLRSNMQFATQCAYKSVIACRLAAILSWTAVLANDRVGGLVFSDKRHLEVKPEGGRRGLINLFRAIVELQSDKVSETEDGNTLSDAVSRLARLSHTGSTIWFFSDFFGLNQRAQSQFSGLVKHNEVNAVHIVDRLDYELPPPGVYRLLSRNNIVRIDTHTKLSRKEYKNRFELHQEKIKRNFSGSRHYYKCLVTDAPLDQSAIDIMQHRIYPKNEVVHEP